jgi:predicted permease
MLALGIGVTTAMFTVIDALILRPVPFTDPDQLAFVYMGSDRGGRLAVDPAVLRAWQATPAFAGAEAAVPETALIEASGTIATRGMARVTPGLFAMLGGVEPVRGRLFDPSDGRAGSDDRVLVSEDLWRALYRSDPSIVGGHMRLNGQTVVVVGILPAEFRFPSWDTVIWQAAAFDEAATAGNFPRVYVRFSPDVPRADALRMATQAAHAADSTTAKLYPRVQPVAEMVLDAYYQRAVPLLAGGVVLVFLVLCANVSSLLLARLTARRREFSMRSALGASRERLLQQAFVESGVMGLLGILGGIGIAWLLVSLSRGFLPEAFLLQTLNPLNIDMRTLAVTSLAGVLATVGAGLLPAWIGTRVDADSSLRVADRGGTETRGARVVMRTLLVTEIALACTLLVGATLLVRSFVNLANAERGLDATGVVIATMSLSSPAFPDRPSRVSAARVLEEEVRALPGVQQVAWSYGLPPDGGAFSTGIWQSDAPGYTGVEMTVEQYNVGADFFALYGIPLLHGRTFQVSDAAGDVVVGERLARALWPGLDPVGRSFSYGKERFHVIGLVREIHHPSLEARLDRPEFYRRFNGVGSYAMLSLRCRAACPDVASVRHRLFQAQPAARVWDVRLLEDVYFEQLARPRATAALGFAFAGIALLAAAGGLFSVLTYAVGRRTREFGIRTALGASPAQIRRVVFREGLTVALAGATIGVVAAWSLARALRSLQYGVAMTDPLTWSLVLGTLAITVLAASWRPAREAVRADPIALLRED